MRYLIPDISGKIFRGVLFVVYQVFVFRRDRQWLDDEQIERWIQILFQHQDDGKCVATKSFNQERLFTPHP